LTNQGDKVVRKGKPADCVNMVYRPILNIYKLYFISQPITWMIINTLTENSKKNLALCTNETKWN